MKTKTHPDTIYNLTVYDARKPYIFMMMVLEVLNIKILILLIALLLFLI